MKNSGQFKVLFLAQLPPPFHGQSVVTGAMYKILRTRKKAAITHIWKGGARSATDVGKRSFSKYIAFAVMISQLFWLLLRGQRFDVAYLGVAPWAHTISRDAILILLAKLVSKRVWIHVHGEGLDQFFEPKSLKQKVISTVLKKTELIALTREAVTAGKKWGEFSVVHHLPNFAEDPGEIIQANEKTLRLGTVGNLDPRKGVFEFVATVKELVANGISVKGHIIGGPTAALSELQMKEHVASYGLEKEITVTGRVSEEEKKALLSDIDIFLYPSRHDLAPLSLIEALAHSCVPVVFATGGIPEIVGDHLQKNVLSLELNNQEFAKSASGIIQTYACNNKLLSNDAKAVRKHFSNHYSEESFSRNVLSMLAVNPDRKEQGKGHRFSQSGEVA